jgi:translation initiation factor 1
LTGISIFWQKRGYHMGVEERSTLVFASGVGRIKEEKPKAVRPQGDGVVRITLKRLGGGKMASVVSGVPMEEDELKELARVLKQKCGVGGSVKDFNIEIQGDKRNVLKAELEKKGFTVKLAGG